MTKQQGFSLIEVLLVLAIVMAITLAVFKIYQSVDNSRKVNQAANMVLDVYQAAAQVGTPLPSGDLIAYFVAEGFLSQADFQTNLENINPWGGTITAVNTSGGYGLQVGLTNVPLAQCNNLLNKFKAMNDFVSTKSNCNNGFTAIFQLIVSS